MSNYGLTSKLLEGLGKPTLRGIKKCQKCGTYNGTRGTFCKNRACRQPLKTSEDHALDFDAVKLVTGNVRQVYSVSVKDTVSNCRGFVQLPLLQSSSEDSNILSDVALCFVDSCQRSFDNSILKCHEEGPSNVDSEVCEHISFALKSQRVAKPVKMDQSVLSFLKIPSEIKETLCLLASDNESPVVQRVSKDVMAVKCLVTPKQPLGYLHFVFSKGRNKTYEKYYCSCTEYLISATKEQSNRNQYKCIHYYACVVALASDPCYPEEFSLFIGNEIKPNENTLSPKPTKQIDPVDVKKNKINTISNLLIKRPCLLKKEPTKSSLKKQKYIIKRCKKIVPKIYPIEIKVLNEEILAMNKNDSVAWPFLDWLMFVTESINKTMQFINCGIINTQVFYIPEDFFVTFKKRIPPYYEEQQTEIGSVFYSIMNINHVKEIFDTSKVKLRIAKKYIHDELKGYVEYDENNEPELSNILFHSSFIFFLNVGQSTVDESDNCNNPFVIEWLPNICTNSKVGQLKVQYKYGRKSI